MNGAETASLPPDLARKVLGADLRNIVKKAGEGQTLTAQERTIIRQFLSEKIEPEELLASRRNALLQIWASGKKLSPDEFAEIADCLPTEAVPVGDFVLEASSTGSGPKSNGRYPKPLAHYAAFYGQTDRTIKRYISKGRKAADFPPLDYVVDMPAWFARHHKHRVPDWLLDLAAKAADSAPAKSAPGTPVVPAPEPPAPAAYIAPSELPVGSGFEAELLRVREEARKASAILSDAEKRGVVSEIDAARRQYDRSLKLLREYERDAPKILASMGNLVDRTVVEALLVPKHAAIRADLEAAYTMEVHREFHSQLEFELARRVYVSVIHRCLRQLEASGFGEAQPFALDAA